jgi:hypothetical protein
MSPNNFKSFKHRENFGLSNESHYKNEICNYYKDFGELTKSIGKYEIFDFYNDKLVIELKCRTNTYDKYPTTIIGYNKVEEGFKSINKGQKVIFLFGFTDGLYEFELNDSNWNEIGGLNSISSYYGCKYSKSPIQNVQIPIHLLKKIIDKKPLEK